MRELAVIDTFTRICSLDHGLGLELMCKSKVLRRSISFSSNDEVPLAVVRAHEELGGMRIRWNSMLGWRVLSGHHV